MNFKKSLYIPEIGIRYATDFDNAFDGQIKKFLKKNIDKYEMPTMDNSVLSEIRKSAAEFGVTAEMMDTVDRLLEGNSDSI